MSKIQWTNETWNPIIGCDKISEGCKECYAEKMAFRLAHIESTNYYNNVLKHEQLDGGENNPDEWITINKWNSKTHFVESLIQKPLHWKKPRMIFVCSMGDLFHESVPFEWIEKVFDIMAHCDHHIFQILTKRPERMAKYIDWYHKKNNEFEPLDNIWLGVTAENQEQANRRIPILLDIPAAKRFVSCEPLLSDIDLHPWLEEYILPSESMHHDVLNGLHWIIVGPETGPKKRPMKKEWIENIYQQCKAANVPFFDKKDTLELNLKQFP